MELNGNNKGEDTPRRGRPKGSVKENKSDKILRGVRLPKDLWTKIEALQPVGVTLSKVLEEILNAALEDTLAVSPDEAGIPDGDQFLANFMKKFDLARPLTALGSVLEAVGQIGITRGYKKLEGSLLTAPQEEMEEIARFVLDHTRLPVALVERAGKWLVWWGESASPEVLKMRNGGRVITRSWKNE